MLWVDVGVCSEISSEAIDAPCEPSGFGGRHVVAKEPRHDADVAECAIALKESKCSKLEAIVIP